MAPRTFILIATVIVLHGTAAAQAGDTTHTARAREQHRAQVRGGLAGFRDENGNGIDDRIERQGNGSGSRKDRFIDADGDGICDGRTGGLGFKRGAAGGQHGAGNSIGSGKRYGQGGKK